MTVFTEGKHTAEFLLSEGNGSISREQVTIAAAAAALPAGYRVQLVPHEYEPGGVFERLTPWLDAHMGRFGFYRPYASSLCGAGIEPWHLSYWPVADEALEGLTLPVLRRALDSSAIEGKAQLLERLPEVYTRFILAVDSSVPAAVRAAARRG
jgi:LAS superfamily LD-carboxypeptidase LdcB